MIRLNTKGLEDKRNRIKKLPRFYADVLRAKLQKDADGVIKEFKKGITNNTFALKPLKPKTIKRKRKQGFKYPENPLYGKGGLDPRTYKNMLIIRKGKNTITVRPSNRRHWKSKLTLRSLLIVHEFGTIIKTRKATIRIPPRPAFQRAYSISIKKRVNITKDLNTAIFLYIKSGKEKTFKIIELRLLKGLGK
jgi:hypothetical protein